MRDIKFRGKDYKNKWRIGDLVQEKWGKSKAIMIKKNKIAWSVLEKTVGEYTGLKDKNGVEIYEGDIVKYNGFYEGDCHYNSGIGQILWDDEDTGFYLTAKDTSFIDLFNLTRNLDAEVIGNIYDNPELLKGEKLVE